MYDRYQAAQQRREEEAQKAAYAHNASVNSCNYADECCAVQERRTVRSFETATEGYLSIAHDIAGNILNLLIGSPPEQMKACASPTVQSVPVMATVEMNAHSAESLVRRLHELQSLIS